LDLAPLPFTRKEIAAIRALFGAQAAAYVGDDATEARARTEVQGPSYVQPRVTETTWD